MKNKSAIDRLNRMLLGDCLRMPGNNFEIVKKELLDVLSSYFDIEADSFGLVVRPIENGKYELYLQGIANGAKKVRTIF